MPWEGVVLIYYAVRSLVKLAPELSVWILPTLAALSILLVIWKWRYICYYGRLLLFYVICFNACVMTLPLAIFRPRNVNNALVAVKLALPCLSWMNIDYEFRGLEHLSEEKGGIICANHQQSSDLLGVVRIWCHAKKLCMTMKRPLIYNTGGVAAWLCGFAFIKQSGGPEARAEINAWIQKAKRDKFKVWIYPEGTRNRLAIKTKTLLPFRKGAFAAAIIAQVPIIPVVFSPYYFMHQDIYYQTAGKLIMEVLPEVSTEGLTMADVDYLKDRVQKMMQDKYRELHAEVLSSLPEDHPIVGHINDIE